LSLRPSPPLRPLAHRLRRTCADLEPRLTVLVTHLALLHQQVIGVGLGQLSMVLATRQALRHRQARLLFRIGVVTGRRLTARVSLQQRHPRQ
jgi:hypothetical protein